MKLTPEERLEKVEELIADRDEITEQLLVLMGGAEEEEVEEGPEPQPTSKRKARVCSQCGRPGHMRNKCDGNPASNVAQKTARKNREPCDECGSIGTRHFTTCSKSGTKKEARTILDAPVRLNEEEYKEVCEALNDGLTIEQVGFNYPDVDLSEIRKAKIASGYEDYISGLSADV